MRRGVPLVVALAGMLLASGCSGFAGLSDVPLPGGPDLGNDPWTITVETADVLNLARQATVKVNDVSVGVVDTIERDGWNAKVTMRIRSDVDLPANTVAAIRQTGLLGEKYVELSPPVTDEPTGAIEDGALIAMDRTSRSFEVEEVLGALSLLLNGGGIDRIHTITTELNNALEGREGEYRALLAELTDFTATLDRHSVAITDAIDGLDRLSSSAAEGQETIERALADIPDSLRILSEQHEALVEMLTATSRLSDVATTTIDRTRVSLLQNLRTLDPVLTQLAASGESIPQALEYLLTFPFPTEGLQALQGDYFNFDLELQIKQQDLVHLLGGGAGSTSPPPGDAPGPGVPTLPPADILGDLLDLLLGGVP
ncbi:MCE family protein [Nocardioides limicola]|uniref:MCE family protein n=1 Tax=Nocardioides limicola TaxID=2803368 RepID=UPI00193C059D|nr:MCE family protein [Nocardioides sp. DJM-14]